MQEIFQTVRKEKYTGLRATVPQNILNESYQKLKDFDSTRQVIGPEVLRDLLKPNDAKIRPTGVPDQLVTTIIGI